jgi:hypothetical protein
MVSKWILLPVVVQMGLTLFLYWAVSARRIAEFKAGKVRVADIAIDADAFGHKVRLFQNSLRNQFELPVLFYVVSAFVYASGRLFWWEAALAVAFVVSRLGHCRIHVTSNHLKHRFRWFVLGWGLLILYMLSTALRLLIME